MKNKKSDNITLIAKYSKGTRLAFFVGLVFSMITTMFNALTPQLIRISVDSIIDDMPFDMPDYLQPVAQFLSSLDLLNALLIMSVSVVVVAMLSGLSNLMSRTTLAQASERFIKKLRDDLFMHTQRLPLSFHVKHQTGDIIQRCTSDTEVIRNFIANQFSEVFRILFMAIFTVSIMFSMNVKLTVIAVAFLPIIVLYTFIFYRLISKRFLLADEAEGALSSVVQENLTGVRVVRAFGRQKFELDKFDKKNEEFANLWIKLGVTTGYYWGIGDLITGLQVSVVMIFAIIEAVNGTLTLGEFLIFYTYNTGLIWPIRRLGRILSDMSKASVSFDRVNYILSQDEEQDTEGAVDGVVGDIEFKNVSFGYANEDILKNISFSIKKGETFAILGATGSGKSTIVQLLDRLYDLPDGSGEITINGTDIRKLKLAWVRKNIGMVLQEPFLFSRTIAQNISAAHDNVTMENIRENARIACVDDSISSFSLGYETMVGERGVTLSGGQKQRVAISRMLMQRAPIMVFDDSLSAVDSETDSKIRAALQEKMGTSTVIIISHRITTLMQADKIMVLSGGEVVQLGSHDELLSQDGIYKQIYDIQMNKDIEEV